MTKDCQSIRTNLSAYLDQELTPERLARVEEHLRHCPTCPQELDDLEIARRALHEIRAMPEGPEQWQHIYAKLQTSGRTWSWKPSLRPRWLAVAASVVLVILTSIFFWPLTGDRKTGVEPYLGLYLLAANASDVLSSQIPADQVEALHVNFPVYTPSAVGSWKRERIYLHKLHGQPVLQVFYTNTSGQNYCVFQQSAQHFVDFGDRNTKEELVQNNICTKLSARHFDLISWSLDKTRFTAVSTQHLDLKGIAADWMAQVVRGQD